MNSQATTSGDARRYRRRSICFSPLAVLALVGCNLLPGTLGKVDLPYAEERTHEVERQALPTNPDAQSETLEEGLKSLEQRVPREDGANPTAVDEFGDHLEPLTLDSMRILVLENNLGLAVARLDPQIAATRISAEEGRFDALIGSKFEYRRRESPRLDNVLVDLDSDNPSLDGEIVKLTELEQTREDLKIGAGLAIPLPTGGTIGIDTLFNRKIISEPDRFEQYVAGTRFSLSQPLLRNAGADASLASIRLARVDQRLAATRTKLAALRVLARSEKAYWRLYGSRRFLDVRSEQYRLAAQNLELVRRRVGEGLSPRIEISRSEVGLYKTLEALIIAETDWRLRQRDLKAQLASSRFPLRGEQMIEPATQPTLASLSLDVDALIDRAMRERLDLIRLELGIVRDGIDIAFRENQVLPIANLDFQYGTLERDGSLGEAWTSSWDFDNPELFVGLSVKVPLTNQRRKAQRDAAILSRAQRFATKRAREFSVREEVYDAVDILERNWQRIVAARQNVIVAGVNFDAEQRQFAQGLRTMREVFEALTDLGDARIREVRAIVDYQVAQIDLAFATGTLLGYARVDLAPLTISSARK